MQFDQDVTVSKARYRHGVEQVELSAFAVGQNEYAARKDSAECFGITATAHLYSIGNTIELSHFPTKRSRLRLRVESNASCCLHAEQKTDGVVTFGTADIDDNIVTPTSYPFNERMQFSLVRSNELWAKHAPDRRLDVAHPFEWSAEDVRPIPVYKFGCNAD